MALGWVEDDVLVLARQLQPLFFSLIHIVVGCFIDTITITVNTATAITNHMITRPLVVMLHHNNCITLS